MAKITGGLLGKVTNRIGGAVYSSWKGINVARIKVTPANPKTAEQQQVRGIFAQLVFIGRAVFSTFISTYWNDLVKGKPTSGWAKFIGVNQKLLSKNQNLKGIVLATGDLEGVKNFYAEADSVNNKLLFHWSKETVSNGSAADKVYLHAWSDRRNYLYTQSIAITRNDEQGTIDIPNLEELENSLVCCITLENSNLEFSTTQSDIDG